MGVPVSATVFPTNDMTPSSERFVGDSGVKQIWTDSIIVSNIIELFLEAIFSCYVKGQTYTIIRIKINLYLPQNLELMRDHCFRN
jgi:hypothetical protein